jgi:hypothetical protein|tara:strand:+ start:1737 stop:2072 length:336 start_codon:yes stop_codon:yes gene_type:complete
MSFIDSEDCYKKVNNARYTTSEYKDEALSECDEMQKAEYDLENVTVEPVDETEVDEGLEDVIEEDEEEEEEKVSEIKKIEVAQAGFSGMSANTMLIISVIGLLLIYAYKTK